MYNLRTVRIDNGDGEDGDGVRWCNDGDDGDDDGDDDDDDDDDDDYGGDGD